MTLIEADAGPAARFAHGLLRALSRGARQVRGGLRQVRTRFFLEYFDGVPSGRASWEGADGLAQQPCRRMEEFRKWRTQGCERKKTLRKFSKCRRALGEQTESTNGGLYLIGTNGYSNFGNSGHTRRASVWAGRACTAARFRWRGSAGRLPQGQCARYPKTVSDGVPPAALKSSRRRRPKRSSTWMGPCARPATTRERCRSATSVRAKYRQGADADGLRRLDGVLFQPLHALPGGAAVEPF